jgi:ABC-type phosphate transport system substrate-binding protein
LAGPAGADTDPTTLSGQGGSFVQPVVSKLIKDDGSNLSPLYGSYLQTDMNAGIAAFVGTGPGQFTADYAVTERPLTAAESKQASDDGRTYAYVPFAATPVAITTLVPTAAWGQTGSTTITSSDFCEHMPLDLTQLAQIFGFDSASPLNNWSDSRIDCPGPGGATTAVAEPINGWANLDPSMANYALMSLLDSTPASQALFQAGLNRGGSLTQDTTPSTDWPYASVTVPGGDQPLLGKMLGINPQTNVPSTFASLWALGATAPISSVWTASPLGVPWNISTAAIQNAQGSFVAPSMVAAVAATADATMATTTDPTTNNLVTFNASNTDAAAYNNYLMVEDYLLVPLNGLPANKANALAQFVRFAVGPTGQKDIEEFGDAPATSAMQTAALKVAAQLNASAVVAANPSSATGSAPSTTAVGGATSASTGAVGSTTGSGGSGGGTSGTDSSGGLAFTGTAHLGVWVGAGLALMLSGAILRRRLKRREAKT